jgi:hypothetical protein
MGTDLGRNIANPQGGQAMYQGGMGAADSMYKANTYNPFATALTGLSQNPALRNLTGSGLTSGAQAAFSQTALGGSGFGTGLAYNNRDLGAFL